MYIYKTTCLINDKIYIGQCSRPLEKTINYFGSGTSIKNSIKKYGKQNFRKEILKICDKQKDLDFWEMVYIKLYKSHMHYIGYNILKGTSNNFG